VSSTQEDIWSQVRIAVSSMERGDETAAEAVIERLLSEFSQDKDIAPAVLQVAESFRKLGKSQKANELYQHVVRNWPNSSCTLLLQTQVANLALERSDNEGLESAIDELLVNFADHKDIAETIYSLISECSNKYWEFVESGTDDAEQIRFYDRIIRRLAGHILACQPDSDYAMWAQRSVVFADIHIGDFAAAEASIEKLIADYPDHADLQLALYFFGNDYRRMAQDDKARQWYQYVINRWPNHHFAVMSRAGIAALNISLGDEETVQAQLNELLADFADYPDLPEAVFEIGEQYCKQAFLKINEDREAEAQEYFRKALAIWERIMTKLPHCSVTAHIYYSSANCCQYLQEYEKAIEYYQRVVDEFPGYIYVWDAQFCVGYCYKQLQSLDAVDRSLADSQIRAAYERVLKNYPNCPSAKAAATWLNLHKVFE